MNQDAYMILAVILFTATLLFFVRFQKQRKRRKLNAFNSRKDFIEQYELPNSIRTKLLAHYPHLNESELDQVMIALKEWFHVCHAVGKKMVSMPSQVVDLAWHEFILYTKQYQAFCDQALGRFLHHTPSEGMKKPKKAQLGIKRAWRVACKREKISPYSPRKLPLLFQIDKKLKIPDGFVYSRDCRGPKSPGFCAVHISCTSCNSGCGGHMELSQATDSTFSCSSGCSSGCGGD